MLGQERLAMKVLMLVVRAAISATMLFALASTSQAQSRAECLASFKVKNKPVTLDLLPGSTTAHVTTCEKAEAWRTQFYIANEKTIDAAVTGTSAFYVSELENNLATRQAAVKELEDKIRSNASLSALAIVAKVIIGEASKTEALLTCTKKPKSPSCVLGVISIISFSWDVISGDIAKDNFAELVAKQKQQLAEQVKQVNALKAQLSAIDMKQIKADVEQTFFGLCRAIKRDCLN